jgi:glucose/arabinose dehydrogenase
MLKQLPVLLATAVLAACGSNSSTEEAANLPFVATPVATLDEPWAMAFLPDGRILVTEKRGALKVLAADGTQSGNVAGVPAVKYAGQGGLGDIALHPKFADNGLVYISYAEAGEGDTAGAAVARGKLALDAAGGGALKNVEVIWRQTPKVTGDGHYGQRLLFAADGFLYITSGERQKFDPAQDYGTNLGKIVRVNDDGTLPIGNPFVDQGPIAAQAWTLGHRNPLGIAADLSGRLWNVEMGPAGGDELNVVDWGGNYGWPEVSNGDHYDGRTIPDHRTRFDFHAPSLSWNPSISPSSLMFYSGSEFPQWRGNAFIGGLSSEALLRVEVDGAEAREADRFPMGKRIRAVTQGPDGAIWLLEDGAGGRLLKLTAPRG